MKKIPTMFVRDPDDRAHVLSDVAPGCEWVIAGEGIPTRKYDGTCVMLDTQGQWWARREIKPGKAAPTNFVGVQHDETTGKTVGWEPIEQSGFYKHFLDAVPRWVDAGTYELIGPKINGNPERVETHRLVKHSRADEIDVPDRSYEGIKSVMAELRDQHVEGIVFHHPDDRMAKIKVRDFKWDN